MDSLLNALRARSSGALTSQHVNVNSNFITPGYASLLAAHCVKHNIPQSNCSIPDQVVSYLSAMGFEREVWGVDFYENVRRKEGDTYSTLVHLLNSEQVNTATQTINSCVREFVPDSHGRNQLCKVIQELLDNVWSHGYGTAFSMAQSWKVPYEKDRFIEFAVVDLGVGFLKELASSSIAIDTDQSAIEWCLVEGNSTKLAPDDSWAQQLPDDAAQNPFGPNVETATDPAGNHHQGLGLHLLAKLVQLCAGTLTVASGSKCMIAGESGQRHWHDLDLEWCGVAISCRVKQSKLQAIQKIERTELQESLGDKLTGGWQ